MGSFRLPEQLRLGVAAAATQIEGGDTRNSWYAWYKQGHIKDGSDPSRAAGHYARWEEDAALMRECNIQIYRMGIEWSRIEPEEGRFDEEALLHYRKEIELLRSYGIEVLLTLHHFTNPLWFEEKGAFLAADAKALFLRFVERAVTYLGDLIEDYVTINEPNVYATLGYFYGEWPPGECSFFKTLQVMRTLAECHIGAYERIHRIRKDMGRERTRVGFAHHMRVFAPQQKHNPVHSMGAKLSEWFFQTGLERLFYEGKGAFLFGSPQGVKPGLYCDFHGLNYYTRSTVTGIGDGVRENAPINDLGWEIYPAGIVECTAHLYKLYQLPVYITENGTCDNTDAFRSRYIYEHLEALVNSGLPVERYYHWCFTDNFEWLEGESSRFGIVHTDYQTLDRTIKDSGRFFAAVIAEHGVSEELYGQYCNISYRTNGEG